MFCFVQITAVNTKMSEMETSTLDESQVEENRLSYEGIYLEKKLTQKFRAEILPKLNRNVSEQLQLVNAISTPMASKKLMKRVFKCAKKASKEKTNGLRRGVKVFTSIEKNSESNLILGCSQVYQKRRKGIGCFSW